MANLNSVVERIKADADLKKQFAQAVKENKVVEFCKGLGVETTQKEIVSFIKSKKCELSEAELNVVNGGCNSSTDEVRCDAVVSLSVVFCVMSSIVNPLSEVVDGEDVSSCLDG